MSELIRIDLRSERDVVACRQLARRIAAGIGFDTQDQTRISTAVSEIARNAQRYARGGSVTFSISDEESMLGVEVRDTGPGITDLDSILRGKYVSTTGMGLGLIGVQRLMDEFDVKTGPSGTTVSFCKKLGRLPPPRAVLQKLSDEIRRELDPNPMEELQRQNNELMRALDELRNKQLELADLNRELEDTNRGVVALYAELDEKAVALQRASEAKSRFYSSMSHEFRTPLNSIISLSRLLLDRLDGDLTGEQERQVKLIQRSARELSEIVDDLLDLAKIEAGKIPVRPHAFSVGHLFGALRGVLRPLVEKATVQLDFDEAHANEQLFTDESKLTQILRNFISNALKYTEHGQVHVSVKLEPDDRMCFSVRDTGIGIAEKDIERIFEEFAQVENPLQRKVKGTGLGLPLSRRLAELLGGHVSVESELGKGSNFSVTIPRHVEARDA
jgi:signal transduction histidine kinase